MRTVLLTLIFMLALLPRLALADTAQPVTMTVVLDKSVYQIGQPIVLEVDLHNSQKAIRNSSAMPFVHDPTADLNVP